jgi:hypothetical protein
MNMFSNATLDDFATRLDWHLNNAIVAGQDEIGSIDSKMSASGTCHSGARIKLAFKVALAEHDKGIISGLGELRRIVGRGVLDKTELRRIAYERLHIFTDRMKILVKLDNFRGAIPTTVLDDFYSSFDQKLTYLLRQFDVGFEELRLPEEPYMSNNSITIDTMLGGGIQQGTRNSSQVNTAKFDASAALSALAKLQAELATTSLSPDIEELQADLATIKVQLQKAQPNSTILTEAVRSVRNVTEGIVAGAMTNRTVQLATDLLRSLGF